MAKVALLGHGVVGSGIAKILEEKPKLMEQRVEQPLELKYVLDLKTPDVPYKSKFIDSIDVIVSDPEVSVVAEAIGGINPAFDFISQCLKAGKHVVTANKELVAEKGAQLLKLAKENNVNFMFEASVGGGIPIIRPLHQCLAANNIISMAGILNGTSNYILTEMFGKGTSFDDALRDAQELGYAEADPTDDVDGIDTGRKICILASLAYGSHVYPDNIKMQGIRSISDDDVALAEKLGSAIKLIGYAGKNGENIEVFVSPMIVPAGDMLYGVVDVYNAVEIVGDSVDNIMLYGKGAGSDPTASAIVGDIIHCVRQDYHLPSIFWEDSQQSPVVSFEDVENAVIVEYDGSWEDVKAVVGNPEKMLKDQLVFKIPARPMGEIEKLLSALSEKGRVISSMLVLE